MDFYIWIRIQFDVIVGGIIFSPFDRCFIEVSTVRSSQHSPYSIFAYMPFASRAIRLPQPKTKQMAYVRASVMKDETNQLKPYDGLLFQFSIEEIQ